MAITRGEKKLAVICALALAVPLGVAAFIGHINATPTIAATAPAKPPNPNGYDLYIQASNSIKEAKPSVDAILDLKPPTDPKLRAQRYSWKRKDVWLAQNKAGFALFKKAQQAQSLAPPYGAKSQGREIRQMARYKVIESNAHWQRGDFNAALQSGLDILQMGYDSRRSGNQWDWMTGNVMSALTRGTTGDTIEHLNVQQARAGAQRVEQLLATRWTLEQSLAEEKAREKRDWLDYFATPDWRAAFMREHDRATTTWGGDPLTWKQRALIRITSKRQILADLDKVYERVIANARLPYGAVGQPQITVGNPFVDETYIHLARRGFNSARALNSSQLLMLQLALRAYQIEHGAPPNLQALVPNYIKAVPVDPFGNGAPLRYKTDGKTYTLWSIGPDGRDDGGKPIQWRKKAPIRYSDEREKLPFINDDSRGDYVAGKNH